MLLAWAYKYNNAKSMAWVIRAGIGEGGEMPPKTDKCKILC